MVWPQSCGIHAANAFLFRSTQTIVVQSPEWSTSFASIRGGVGHTTPCVPYGKSTMSIDLTDLRNLPVSEKLRIVEALWDDIGASDEPIVLQTWQRDEAQRRSLEMKANPSIAIDRDELWRRVNG